MIEFSKAGGPPVGFKKVAIIGSYLPRQCGIATFTYDIRSGLQSVAPHVQFDVVAMSDVVGKYDYPEEVCFEIDQNEPDSYRKAASFLNANGYDALCIQHEYGIFGGPAGSFLLDLVRRVEMPVITTLHTVLANPSDDQRRVLEELARLSSSLSVISQKGAEFLQSVHGINPSHIRHIPHGVPGPAHSSSNVAKQVGLRGDECVILTFGLISPDKGIENAIRAMPQILEEVPNAVYVIVGATHPHIRAKHGEVYRESLEALAMELGVEKRVRFLNRFVELSELTEFLALADIYLTPYLKEEQISSGTLAYAVGSGCVTVSTPYWYAQELLAEDRGLLVPFGDSSAIADSVTRLMCDDQVRAEMEGRTIALGRKMTWPVVCKQHLELIQEALQERLEWVDLHPEITRHRKPVAPAFNLRHLVRMTDSTGLLQHATYNVPNYHEGYSIDDNCRAAIFAARYLALEGGQTDLVNDLLARYMGFLNYAFNPKTKRFRNFLSYDRRWLERSGSEDCHGRTLWALGFVRSRLPGTGYDGLAYDLFRAALPSVSLMHSPRALAYALLGICALPPTDRDAVTEGHCEAIAADLYARLQHQSTEDWPWFEDVLAYCNARLPQALILAGRHLRREDYVEAGLRSLDWLIKLQVSPSGLFEPIGSDRVYRRGEEKPRFDQQPVEAHSSLSACITAYEVTKDAAWESRACTAFEWFQGFNHLRGLVCDPTTGGCRDGVERLKFNENQGAESMLSWLLAVAEMRESGLAETCPDETPAYLS